MNQQSVRPNSDDRPVVRPAVEIIESETDIILLAEMPGVGENDADVGLKKNVLTIRGTTNFAQPEGFEAVYAEYAPTNYERSFSVSDDIDRENIEATVKNGILSLRLPKSKQAQPHKITVKAG